MSWVCASPTVNSGNYDLINNVRGDEIDWNLGKIDK